MVTILRRKADVNIFQFIYLNNFNYLFTGYLKGRETRTVTDNGLRRACPSTEKGQPHRKAVRLPLKGEMPSYHISCLHLYLLSTSREPQVPGIGVLNTYFDFYTSPMDRRSQIQKVSVKTLQRVVIITIPDDTTPSCPMFFAIT